MCNEPKSTEKKMGGRKKKLNIFSLETSAIVSKNIKMISMQNIYLYCVNMCRCDWVNKEAGQ